MTRASFPTRVFLLACLALGATVSAASASETVLVAAGTSMTYRANSADPGLGTTWTAEAFTPSGWSSGSYGVGYETSTPSAAALLATTVPAATNSVYTRTTFNIADVSAVNNLFLGADYDDGYVAWINGVEVFRSAQIAAGTPAWNTAATSHESSNGASPNYGTLQDISATAIAALHNGANVLAIGVWNTTLPSTDLVLVPKLSMNVDSSVVRGPYLQMGTPTSVTVRWRTSTASDSCVRYGAAPGSLTSSACLGTSTAEHVVNVTGLTADTTYYYSVGTSTTTQAGNTVDYFFLTSPPTGTNKTTRVWALGDSGTADANARAVRDAYYGYPGSADTDLWLMLGDNAYNAGTDAEYQAAVFDTYPTMLHHSVLWPTLGNHDGATANSSTQSGGYYDIFSLPAAGQAGGVVSGTEAYYSFDYGDIHFICLESYETDRSAGGAMLTWLAADLADTTAQWVVAFFHHPPYSRGSHNSDVDIEMVEMRQNALPILEAGGVDLVLTGHSHSYERTWLLDGHYGLASTFTSGMKLDPGDGREDGSGAYTKSGGGPVSHDGAVYVVAGSSGQMSGGTLNHPAMYLSLASLGSLVLDFHDTRLDVKFLNDSGVAQDHFTIEKTPPAPVCGNGVVEAGEACDDGNNVNTDACLNTCVLAACGDGFVRAGVEQCDDGNNANTDACLNTCVAAACGDGFVRTGVEQCDDANLSNGDACLNTCVVATCGDGFVEAGIEQCDDANLSNGDACLDTCVAATCGDGFVEAGIEQCDDANLSNTDACLNTCVAASCGDGFVESGVEQCDDANLSNTDACLGTCIAASCGDGFVEAGVEQCDDANLSNSDACLNTCIAATCGDGVVHVGVEQCDDGNANDADACRNNCTLLSCGNGVVDPGEGCDDGNANNTDACLNTCQPASCGDGFVHAGVEQCDDANGIDTDACLSTCVAATCGDGHVRAGVEQCDDGNLSNNDSCLNTCASATCGDGFVRTGVEQCDDGNLSNADACLNTCASASCGDGFVRAGVEACDDGNLSNTDACLATCAVAACGDGFVRAGVEACDDGNLSNTDACLTTCAAASCGDGFVEAGVEQCDDANAVDSDACRNTCVAAACGDGVVQTGVEQCDDGNLVTTDDCTASCQVAACGDGSVHAGFEECDDGNASSNDGCSQDCLVDCPAAPRGDCRTAGVSVLKIAAGATPATNVVMWKWLKGAAVALSDLGDPSTTGAYNLCFYPNVPGAGSATSEVLLAPGGQWTAGSKGYVYTDATAGNGGVRSLAVGTGAARKTKLLLRAGGANVPAGLLPANSFTVQLADVTKNACWTSNFTTGFRSATLFKGKSVLP